MKSEINYLIPGPFADCLSSISPNQFVEHCENDVCACGHMSSSDGSHQCHCTAFAAYARECSLKGITIHWRDEDRCGDGMSKN